MTDTFDVCPGASIGPISIGMRSDVALQAAVRAGLSAQTLVVRGSPTIWVAKQLFAYLDDEETVIELEVAIPGLGGGIPVAWGDIDLGADAGQIAELLDAQAEPDRDDPEFPATRVYPALGLSLWKDAKPADWDDGPYESVAVHRPTQAPGV